MLREQSLFADPRILSGYPYCQKQEDPLSDAILRTWRPIHDLDNDKWVAYFHPTDVKLTSQYAFYSTFSKWPYSYTWVITSSCKSFVIRTETKPSNSFARWWPLPCRQVVHIGFEILDDTTFVCRREIRPRMSETHGTYCWIMGLQDGLEVEREAIPKCEFTTCRAC
jgi:hypothetical protein